MYPGLVWSSILYGSLCMGCILCWCKECLGGSDTQEESPNQRLINAPRAKRKPFDAWHREYATLQENLLFEADNENASDSSSDCGYI